jgi:2-oxoglutarate dehydrogenase E1 component
MMIVAAITAVVLIAGAGAFVLARNRRGATGPPVRPTASKAAPAPSAPGPKAADLLPKVQAAPAQPKPAQAKATSARTKPANARATPAQAKPAPVATPGVAVVPAATEPAAGSDLVRRATTDTASSPGPATPLAGTLAPPAGTELAYEAAAGSEFVQPAELAFDEALIDRLQVALRPATADQPTKPTGTTSSRA